MTVAWRFATVAFPILLHPHIADIASSADLVQKPVPLRNNQDE